MNTYPLHVAGALRKNAIATLGVLTILGCGGGGTPPNPDPPVPVVTAAGPSAPLGLPGTQATFSVTASESPHSWEWSLGNGVVPVQSSEHMPTVLLSRPGTFSAEVRAGNAAGISAPFAFNYIVPYPSQGIWRQLVYATDLDSTSGTTDYSVIHKDRLVILFHKNFLGYFVAISTPIGSSGDPSFPNIYPLPTLTGPASLLSADDEALYFAAVQVDAQPRVNLRYQLFRSLNDNPLSLDDWGISTFEPSPGDARSTAVLKQDVGWLVAVHTGPFLSPNTDITVYRTGNNSPTGPSDWTSYVAEANTQGFGGFPRLLRLNGRPVLNYGDLSGEPLRVAIGNVADPASPSDWTSHIVVPAVDFSDLTICQGRLVAAWATGGGTATPGPAELHLSTATVDFPQSAADWSTTTTKRFNDDLSDPVFKAFYVTLSTAHGRLLMAYRGVGNGVQDPYLLRATAVFPQGPEDWDERLLASDNSASLSAPFFAHEVNGRIATAFSSPELFFAQLSDGPW